MGMIRRPVRFAHTTGKLDVCYSSDGKYIITCGSDGDIRIWLSVQDDDPETISAGESAQSILIDSENRLFVANDSLLIQILTFPTGEPNGILTQFTAIVTHMAFDTNRHILAAGSDDMTVKVIRLSDSKTISNISEFEGPILSVALNHNGEWVAVSCGDGTLKVFNVNDQSLIKQFDCVPNVNNFNSAEVLCRSSFEPVASKYFAYPDLVEIVILDTVTWKKFCVLTEGQAKGVFSIVAFSPCGLYIAAATCKGCICVWEVASKTLVGYSPFPNKHGISSMAWNPKNNGEIVYCLVTGQIGAVEIKFGNAKDDGSKEEESEMGSTQDPFLMSGFGVEDSDEENDNTISLKKLKDGTIDPLDDNEKDDFRSERAQSRALSIDLPTLTIDQLQPPFQSSSTPAHLTERYLIWNDVGIIRGFNEDTPFIDITFHDSSIHNSMHLQNLNNYTMASLSTKIATLASTEKLNCIPLNGKEWQYEITDEILSIASSDQYVIVATSTRMLRVFTIHGTQREVICIPGPVVTVAAQRNTILVAYHSSIGIGNDQNIMLMIVNIKGICIKSTELRIPLSPGSKLNWLGFTELGSFVTFDSNGILRMFGTKSSTWHPVYDYSVKRSGVSDGLFIVSVNESDQQLNAISCKGSIYPPIAPKPLVGSIDFCITLCESDEKSVLEENLIKALNLNEINTKIVMESALKLFSLACGCENYQRAFELADMLSSIPKFVQICWKYAAKKGKTHLAEKLMELYESIDLFEESQVQDNQMISDIKENRVDVFNSLPVIPSQPVVTESCIQPLRIKQAENNRVKVCKPMEATEIDDETQLDLTKTPTSVDQLGNPNYKASRNPFSKVGKTAVAKHLNPFSISGQMEKPISPVVKKRKEVEPSLENKGVKQRKLDCFKFEKRVETQDS